MVERKTFPREKTCGDGLTPRAVHQLDEMGLREQLLPYHRYHGLRATGMGRELVRQLAAEGCHVAMCDVSAENMEGSRKASSIRCCGN